MPTRSQLKGLLIWWMVLGAGMGQPVEEKGETRGVPEGRQALTLLGAGLAPLVTSLVGPVLLSIANGITNGVVATFASGFAQVARTTQMPRFQAYMVQIPGTEKPYLILGANAKKSKRGRITEGST